MLKRMTVSIALTLCLFGLLCLNNALAIGDPQPTEGRESVVEPQPQTTDCRNAAAVANAVYEKLKSDSDSNLKRQVEAKQINVFFDPRTKRITLFGWATGVSGKRQDLSAVNQAQRLAKAATTCERSVTITVKGVKRLLTVKPDECNQGEVPCGIQSFCVPAGTCTLPPRNQ